MALVSLHDVTLGLMDSPLLENVSLQIERGERIGLLGRNERRQEHAAAADQRRAAASVRIIRDPSLRVALLTQQVPAT